MLVTPFTPIAMPEQITAGPFASRYACRYKDEHGLIQTHLHFMSKEIAWAYALSYSARHNKIPLKEKDIHELRSGDLVLNHNYELIKVIEGPMMRTNVFSHRYYSCLGVYAKDLPAHGLQLLLTHSSCFQIPYETHDFSF